MSDYITGSSVPQPTMPFDLKALLDCMASRKAGEWPARYMELDTKRAFENGHLERLPYLMNADGELAPQYGKTSYTGRTHSSRPHVQGFNRPVRTMFRLHDHVVLRADFSGSHVRLLARISGDTQMLADCSAGDPYAEAKQVAMDLGTPEDRAREAVKVAVLGIFNGMGAAKVQRQLVEAGAPEDIDPAQFIERINARWPQAAAYLAEAKAGVKAHGWSFRRDGAATLTMPEEKRGEHRIPALVLQGLEASAVDRALARATDPEGEIVARHPTLRLIMPLHDETIWVVSPEDAELAGDTLKALMTEELFGEPISDDDVKITYGASMDAADQRAVYTDDEFDNLCAHVEAIPPQLTRREHVEAGIAILMDMAEDASSKFRALATNEVGIFQIRLASLKDSAGVGVALAFLKMARGGKDVVTALRAIIAPAAEADAWATKVMTGTRTELADTRPLMARVPSELAGVVADLSLGKNGKPSPTAQNLWTILEGDPAYAGKLWRNTLDGQDYHDDGELSGNDPEMNLRRHVSNTYGMSATLVPCAEAICQICLENPRNPLVESLEASRQAWEAGDRASTLDTWFTGAFPQLADTPLHRAYARRFILGLVARAYTPGIKFDTALIIVGSQGARKSTFAEVLAGSEYYGESNLNFNDTKAVIEKTNGTWIYELPEFDKYKRQEQEQIKSHLTTTKDKLRHAYARRTTVHSRSTVFIGTSNSRTGVLTDETGSRRFWVIDIGDHVDTEWLKDNREALLGEAAHYYLNNKEEDYLLYLPPELEQEREAHNAEEFTSEDPVEQDIVEILGREIPIVSRSGFSVKELAAIYMEDHQSEKEGYVRRILIPRALQNLGAIKGGRVQHKGIRTVIWSFPKDSPHFAKSPEDAAALRAQDNLIQFTRGKMRGDQDKEA